VCREARSANTFGRMWLSRKFRCRTAQASSIPMLRNYRRGCGVMVAPRKQRQTVKELYGNVVSLGCDGSYNRVAAFARAWKVECQRPPSQGASPFTCYPCVTRQISRDAGEVDNVLKTLADPRRLERLTFAFGGQFLVFALLCNF
jgi:hypothetical protein